MGGDGNLLLCSFKIKTEISEKDIQHADNSSVIVKKFLKTTTLVMRALN